MPRYLALGDSFTIGTGSPRESAFPSRLAEVWRARGCLVEVRNVAVNGYTSEDVIAEELPEIARWRPTFVTVAVGANDIVQGSTPEAYRANVRTILTAAVASGARVVVLPQPDWSRSPAASAFGEHDATASSIARFNAILAREAAEAGATWLDLWPLMARQAQDGMIAADGLHPSAAAYGAWADSLAASVEPPCSAR